MKLHVKSLYQGKRLLDFTIKVHKRAKSELHLDEAFYAYGGGVPDYNYEVEIIESSISDEEIKAKKLHIYYENNEKYVCYPLALKTVSEVLSLVQKWAIIMGFHYRNFDPNWIEDILKYGGCNNPFDLAISYLRMNNYSSEINELLHSKKIDTRLCILHKFLVKNFDLEEEELRELKFFGLDTKELKDVISSEEEYIEKLQFIRDVLLIM